MWIVETEFPRKSNNCGKSFLAVDDFLNKTKRDNHEAAIGRRKKFGDLLELYEEKGIDKNRARKEIFKLIHGKQVSL